MEGELKIVGATIEKNTADENSYATNKKLIKGHPQEVIGGAMDEVERKNNLMGLTEVTEEEIVLGILQELSPDNKKMWEDEEILSWIRKIVQEKLPKKSSNPFKDNKKMLTDSWRHEQSLKMPGGNDKDEI
jgi:hypothetical protein